MFTTLAAVLVALALGHVAPAAAASMRRFDGFRRWLGWLDARGGKAWQGPAGVALALLPPLLLMGLLAWLLRGVLFGLPSLLLGVAVLAWCWGRVTWIGISKRSLMRTTPRRGRQPCATCRPPVAACAKTCRRWSRRPCSMRCVAGSRCCSGSCCWALGALGYRLLALMAESPMRARVPVEPLALAQRLLGWIEWPVAQLMAFSMALVGNFDTAWKAWRQAHGERLAGSIGFLGAVARASVNAELREDAHDYTEAGLLPVWQRLPDLRDAMSLVWRMLLLWLAILALLVIAGWVT